jgi:phosphoserine phosphatase RsbU/P
LNTSLMQAGKSDLPPVILGVLEAFSSAHPTVEVRLWVKTALGRECAFRLGDEEELEGSEPAGRVVEVGRNGSYELELIGAGAEDAAAEQFIATVDQLLAYEHEARAAARELTERYEEINLLYSISETLGSILSLEAASARILAEVADVIGARRASLWVYEAAEHRLRLAAAVGADGAVTTIDVDDPDSATAQVFRHRQPLNLERGMTLPRATRLEPRPHGAEAFLSVPISYTPPEGESRTVGVITVVGGRTNLRFSAGDARLLSAIASQVGAALETHRLVQESLRQERLVRELELAHDLQLKLLPDARQFGGGSKIAARCAPADSVGGDFYHLFHLSGGRLGVTVGDVSGHGFSAAMIMALAMSAIAISAQEAGPPAEVLRRVHRALIGELEMTEMYLTLFYGVIDPVAGTLTYASAGHPHAFCVERDGSIERLRATDPPLGIVPLDEYLEAVAPWAPAETLLCLFTDGLSDAFASKGGWTGETRLIEEVLRLRAEDPQTILEHLFRATDGATIDIPPDDRTAVLVRA